MNLKIGLAIAVAALACGVGSQVAARDDKPAPEKSGGKECFYAPNATSFAAPDAHNLYIEVNVRDVYHFEMFGPCQDIDWNQRIALVANPGPWVCDGMEATVISHATGLGPQRCFVRDIRKLTPDEVKALPKRARP
jgi:hypothetical protein